MWVVREAAGACLLALRGLESAPPACRRRARGCLARLLSAAGVDGARQKIARDSSHAEGASCAGQGAACSSVDSSVRSAPINYRCCALLTSPGDRAFDFEVDELRIGVHAETVVVFGRNAKVAFELAHLPLATFLIREQQRRLAPARRLAVG